MITLVRTLVVRVIVVITVVRMLVVRMRITSDVEIESEKMKLILMYQIPSVDLKG